MDKMTPLTVFTTKVKKGNYNLMVDQNQWLNSIRLVGPVKLNYAGNARAIVMHFMNFTLVRSLDVCDKKDRT